MFETVLKWNNQNQNKMLKKIGSQILEKAYNAQIMAIELGENVRFAHHARGCTIIASRLGNNNVIFQNVTIGSNLKYVKSTKTWLNVGNPVIGDNVIIADGAKILGPIIIGDNTTISASAIITKDIPANSIAYGINQYKSKDQDLELIYYKEMIDANIIIEKGQDLIRKYQQNKVGVINEK